MVALVLSAAFPVAAWSAEWQDGDVFVGLISGQYNVYNNGGTLQETINQGGAGFAVDCAFDRSGVLHTTAFSLSKVVRFIGPHPHTRLTDVPTGSGPESVSFARDGSFYVGHQTNPSSLRKFTGAGAPGPLFTPAHAATLLDLSADQRTMFYTSRSGVPASERQIHRFDVQSSADLTDFANLGGSERIADFKLLPPGDGNGGAIVAQTTDIKRVDGNGQIVQTYDVPGEDEWFGIALDPDGRSFWAQTSSPGNVYRLNIASGAVDRGPLPSASNAFGICVKGTRTAALDNAAPSVRITTPADGATFTQGQSVAADYGCTDDANGTGIRNCSGPVASGAPIDTGSVGTKSFRIDAADNAGNTASRTHTYTVVAPPPPPPPPPPPAAAQRIVVVLGFAFSKSTNRFTRFTTLSVKDVPRGSTVKVTCKPPRGKKCPARTFTKRNAHGTVRFKKWERKKLFAGTKLTVRVTKAGNFIGAVKILTVRKKKAPSITTRCLPPGTTKAVGC